MSSIELVVRQAGYEAPPDTQAAVELLAARQYAEAGDPFNAGLALGRAQELGATRVPPTCKYDRMVFVRGLAVDADCSTHPCHACPTHLTHK